MIDAKDKKALYVYEAYETITGRSCKSLIENPSSYEELIHPDDRGHVLTKLEEAVQNGRFDERFRILKAEGDVRWVWVRQPLRPRRRSSGNDVCNPSRTISPRRWRASLTPCGSRGF